MSYIIHQHVRSHKQHGEVIGQSEHDSHSCQINLTAIICLMIQCKYYHCTPPNTVSVSVSLVHYYV